MRVEGSGHNRRGRPTLGVIALPILFSKKRRHHLTIEYTDGQRQA